MLPQTFVNINGVPTPIQLTTNGAAPIAISDQLDSDNDAVSAWEKGFTYVNISASTQISATSCVFGGIVCTASSTGVWTIYDNTAGSGTIVRFSSATLTANTDYSLNKPIIMSTGCYATLVSGTGTIQVLIRSISK